MKSKLEILKKANDSLNVAISHLGKCSGDIAGWVEYRKLVSCKIKLETIAVRIERDICRRERNKNNAKTTQQNTNNV